MKSKEYKLKETLARVERKWVRNINAIMMDCSSIFRMFQPSNVIDSCGADVVVTRRNSSYYAFGVVQLHKRAKNIRLTHGQSKQPSRCKARLVLLLLGLWMNLIAVANGKWKIWLVIHMFFFFSSQSLWPPNFPFRFIQTKLTIISVALHTLSAKITG